MATKFKSAVSGTAMALMLGLTVSSNAADFAPLPVAVTSWEGFYLGGHFCAGEATWGGTYDANDPGSVVFSMTTILTGCTWATTGTMAMA